MELIAIVGATMAETAGIISDMTISKRNTDSLPFYFEGELDNKSILVMLTGIGKNNAISAIQKISGRYEIKTLISVGVAGAVDPGLEIGDIIIGKTITAQGDDIETLYSNHQLLDSASEACNYLNCKYHVGILLTVPRFIISKETKAELFNKYGVHAVDMETYHVINATAKSGIPVLSIRSISDKANENIKINFEKIRGGILNRYIYFISNPGSLRRYRNMNRNIVSSASMLPPIIKRIISNLR